MRGLNNLPSFILAWALLSVVSAQAENAPQSASREVLSRYHRLDSINSFCSERKYTEWTAEDESKREKLASAIHKAYPISDNEFTQVLNRIYDGEEYNLAVSYWKYIEIPTPPLERVNGRVRFKLSEADWQAEKKAKLAQLIEWCATANKEFRTMLDNFTNAQKLPEPSK